MSTESIGIEYCNEASKAVWFSMIPHHYPDKPSDNSDRSYPTEDQQCEVVQIPGEDGKYYQAEGELT